MEDVISRAIVRRFLEKLDESLSVDVAIVGAGPSALVASRDLARAGKSVAIFERKLAPGGGTWGGGMLFNEIVFQGNVLEILAEFGISYRDAGDGFYTADSVEVASGLIYGATHSGVRIFNSVTVEDIVFKEGRVGGVVMNWTPVNHMGLHVDPLVVTSRVVLDGTGHPTEIATLASRKAGVKLATPTGEVMGEKPMWMESGEASTVENTQCVYPGLYVSGMAANNTFGGFRMGPIFGGMFLSGKKVARMILEELGQDEA